MTLAKLSLFEKTGSYVFLFLFVLHLQDSEGIHSLMCVKCNGPAITQKGDSVCLKCDHIFSNEEMDKIMDNVDIEKELLKGKL